jgi:hypothetical protein
VAVGDRFHVRIDVARIQANMLRDEGGKLTERQIRNWLISAGFTPDPDGPGWTADRDALRQLDRSELLETTPIRRLRASNPASLPGHERSNGRAGSDHPKLVKSTEASPNGRKTPGKRTSH